MSMESCLVGSPKPQNATPARRTVKYPPSAWGDTFLSYEPLDATVSQWREKAESLKIQVQKMLVEEARENLATLNLIDAIQRLGVAYHFEKEIDDILSHIFTCYHDQNHEDLGTMALRFRLLRQHGYNLTCDVFRKFMDDKGNFHKSLCDDADGLLSLYEAAHLRVNGEAILDDALKFTTSNLQFLLPSLTPSLAKQVSDALYRPLRKRLSRLEARNYMSIYQQNKKHNEPLLYFAKLDFNILQKLHQKELSVISKWWKNLNCAKNFPFSRDRVVELYFWILGVYFEPEYSMARIFLVQLIGLTSIIDDMYDNYGSKEELELFTEAMQRWDASAAIDLPQYMKVCYRELLNIYYKAEEELIKQGRTLYGLQCTKKTMKGLLRAYMEEMKWLHRQYIPTLEEYMKVALVTSGYTMLSTSSFVFMGDDSANEKTFDWLLNQPKIVHASSVICRLMDDIVSHKFEQERGHPPSAVECYITQYGVSEEKACQVFRVEIDEAWKGMNEAFLRPTPVAMSILMRVLNLTRVVELLYKESDGHSHVTPVVKEYITSLLRNTVEV